MRPSTIPLLISALVASAALATAAPKLEIAPSGVSAIGPVPTPVNPVAISRSVGDFRASTR